MNTGTQLDLFSLTAPDRAVRTDAPKILFPPPRPWGWENLVMRAAGAELWVHVSRRWAGVVAENLTCPVQEKRWTLWHGRRGYQINEYPARRARQAHRTVFMSADAVIDLHRLRPLIEIDRGDGYARFRFAADGDAPPSSLTIPTIEG